jgi:hypothetical protein
LKESEPFWSPPTRRIAQALMPGFFIGLTLAMLLLIGFRSSTPDEYDDVFPKILVVLWTWLYGCAICAAGFFMPRGIRWLGWIFLISGVAVLVCAFIRTDQFLETSTHILMGGIFGGLHLAYGIYLYFTEKKNPAA